MVNEVQYSYCLMISDACVAVHVGTSMPSLNTMLCVPLTQCCVHIAADGEHVHSQEGVAFSMTLCFCWLSCWGLPLGPNST